MLNAKRLLLAAVAVAVVAGCGRQGDEEFAEAAPDADALALAISGSAEEGVQQSALNGTQIEYLAHARQGVRQLNVAVRDLLQPVVALVNLGPTQSASTATLKVYGPVDRGNGTYRLMVKKIDVGRFGWRVEVKPQGAPDTDYGIVMGGRVFKDAVANRARGGMGVDLDAWVLKDSARTGAGKLFVGYGHGDLGRTLVYTLRGFTPDAASVAPVTAAFVGHRLLPSMKTRVRMASTYNLNDSPTAAEELVRARIRFIPGVGGRADVLATGGDVPAGSVYIGSACWDAQETEGFSILRQCVKGDPSSCTVVAARGAPANCQLGLDQPMSPPEDEQDATPEGDSPDQDMAPPPSMPEL